MTLDQVDFAERERAEALSLVCTLVWLYKTLET